MPHWECARMRAQEINDCARKLNELIKNAASDNVSVEVEQLSWHVMGQVPTTVLQVNVKVSPDELWGDNEEE